jgi:hypothetical protein
MISSSSGISFRTFEGSVTRYAICPVGTGGPGFPITISRAIEWRPTFVSGFLEIKAIIFYHQMRQSNPLGTSFQRV